MKKNIGGWDRFFRITIGIVILILGYAYNSYWGLVGLILIITALLKWCPFYVLFKQSTVKENTIRPSVTVSDQNNKNSPSTPRTIIGLLVLGIFLYVAYNYFGGARMLACGTRDVYYLRMMPEYKGCEGSCSVIGKEVNILGKRMCVFTSKESVE